MKKKVGIITFVHAYNYGVHLQAFAMADIFTKCGFEVEVINFDYTSFWGRYVIERIVNLSMDFNEWIIKYMNLISMITFSKNKIKKTNSLISMNNSKIERYINKQKYDAVICGSDEIWRADSNILQPPSIFFLPPQITAMRIAFASSANGDHVFDDHERKWLINSLNGFEYIAVRDTMTQKKIEQLGINKPVNLTFDPTWLIDDFEISKNTRKKIENKSKVIILAFTKKHNDVPLFLAEYFKQNKYLVYSVFNKIRGTEFLHLTPEEFTCVWKYADLVFTNLFHATVFSLKCNAKVIGIDTFQKYRGVDSKVKDLLERVNCENQYISCVNFGNREKKHLINIWEELLLKQVNYQCEIKKIKKLLLSQLREISEIIDRD